MILEKCKRNDTKDILVAALKAYLENKNVKGIAKLTKAQCVEKILELN